MPQNVSGNTTGLKKVHLDRLTRLYDEQVETGLFVSRVIVEELAACSLEVKRELAVYINRKGKVTDVSVGDNATVSLNDVKGRRSAQRLSGIRCLHTHPGGSSELSDVDLTAMASLNLDAMAAIGFTSGGEPEITVALPAPAGDVRNRYMIYGPYSTEEIVTGSLMEMISLLDEEQMRTRTFDVSGTITEKAVLVGLQLPGSSPEDLADSLAELAQLASTAGVEVVEKTFQARPRPDVATYAGKGKVEEIRLTAQVREANVVIFDGELSPAQLRNLELMIGLKIIDRTALILDIFAQRARTMEGKLQVELAQLNYLLPRLTGKGIALSRLGGGIGTRGPGETKLEMDRRRIRKRIADLNSELALVKKNRELHRQNRKGIPLPVASLCGYTNSGKSTLLNRLTNSEVLAEDKLFATLDPTTRKLELPGNKRVLLTDTVGFINKIPHHLIAAFRATLEEVVEADVLLHVVDISHPAMEQQIESVLEVLRQLDAVNKTIITVFNKIDRTDDSMLATYLKNRFSPCVFISARTGEGLDRLLETMVSVLPSARSLATYAIPYGDSALVALFHNQGHVRETAYLPEHILVTAELDEKTMARVAAYRIADSNNPEVD